MTIDSLAKRGRTVWSLALAGWCCFGWGAFSLFIAAQEPPATPPASASVQELVKRTKASLAVISVTGRDGKRQGLGSGFVVSADGLIATNLHVIGEARPITVELADGQSPAVLEIHAWDRQMDLAVLRVDAKDLKPLELHDDEPLSEGAPLVVQGNPQGLKHSVVAGVVSGYRDIDERRMLQIAMPIEPGNSGGPAIDDHGRVVGVVTMKSAVTDNLGFAVPVDQLRKLLERPNPTPIARWLTIGALDPVVWTPTMGADWKQRGGRILVTGTGQGFGGRSLCLNQTKPPETPYEIAVSVKLDDEAGAAGLAFLSDGKDRHFGFYPTNGKMRLTRFEGADVFTWQVLAEEEFPVYRAGDWNDIRVRIEAERVTCFVNGQQAFVHNQRELGKFAPAGGGLVGLAKFRQTQAEFKGFRILSEAEAKGDAGPAESRDDVKARAKSFPALAEASVESVRAVAVDGRVAGETLEEEARSLETRAKELRLAAADARTLSICDQLAAVAGAGAPMPDLLRGALWIARLDESDIDVDGYAKMVDRMASDLAATLPEGATEAEKWAALNKWMFQENGFHGSRTDYYSRANSYLNRVLDDREGLPITLSVVQMELGRRIGLKVEGVALPGHFVTRFVPAEGEPQMCDPFDGAKLLSREDADKLVRAATGDGATEEQLAPATTKAILTRMLTNLLGRAQSERDPEGMIRYLSGVLAIDPMAARERGMLAIAKFETGRKEAAAQELDAILAQAPEGIDLDRIREMQRFFRRGK